MLLTLTFLILIIMGSASWYVLRQSADENSHRFAATVSLLLVPIFPAVVAPFTIFATKTPLGQLSAAVSWLFIVVGLVESHFLGNRTHLSRPQRNAYLLCLGYWAFSILSALAISMPLRPNALLLPAAVCLLWTVRPSRAELLRALAPIFLIAIIANWFYLFSGLEASVSDSLTTLPSYLSGYGLSDYRQVSEVAYRNFAWSLAGTDHRFIGSFTHANSAGLFFGIVFVCATQFRKRWVRLFVCGSAFFMLLLTSSRTSILATVLAVLFLATDIVEKKDDSKVQSNVLKIFARLVYFVLVPSLLFLAYASNRTVSGRSRGWANALGYWSKNRFLGVGVDGGPLKIPGTENQYLTVLTFQGILGLSVFLCFVVAWWSVVRTRVVGYPRTALAIFILIQVDFMTETPFSWNGLGLGTLALFVSLAFVQSVDKNGKLELPSLSHGAPVRVGGRY